jgi:hypothetical protein
VLVTALCTAIRIVAVFVAKRNIKEVVLQRGATRLLFAVEQTEPVKGARRRLEKGPNCASLAQAVAQDVVSPWDEAAEASARTSRQWVSVVAMWSGRSGDLLEAKAQFRELLEEQTRLLGPNHPNTLITAENLRAVSAEMDALKADEDQVHL